MALSSEEKEVMRMRMQNSLSFNHHQPQENPKIINSDPNNSTGLNKSKSKSVLNLRISYRECLKNHAANMGGNVTDGCGEFMPSGEDGTLEALKCAACSCHRNFHRKESPIGNAILPQLPSPSMSQHRAIGPAHWSPMIQPVKMTMESIGTDSSSEELNFGAYHSAIAPPPPQFSGKKRFRTKFTTDQKEKMLAFAEKLGWRIPREDDTEVQRFCAEVGVKRQVFKVWMHNNKSTSGNSSSSGVSKDINNGSNPQGF